MYWLRFYSNSLILILSLSNSHNNIASIQKNQGDKSHRVIVAWDSSLYVHYMFTMFTRCSLYIHYMFTIYSLYVHYIYIHYIFTVYSLHIYSLYVHYIFTICSLYAHYLFTIYKWRKEWFGCNSMDANKSPGKDCLSKEFYIFFFNEIPHIPCTFTISFFFK